MDYVASSPHHEAHSAVVTDDTMFHRLSEGRPEALPGADRRGECQEEADAIVLALPSLPTWWQPMGAFRKQSCHSRGDVPLGRPPYARQLLRSIPVNIEKHHSMLVADSGEKGAEQAPTVPLLLCRIALKGHEEWPGSSEYLGKCPACLRCSERDATLPPGDESTGALGDGECEASGGRCHSEDPDDYSPGSHIGITW